MIRRTSTPRPSTTSLRARCVDRAEVALTPQADPAADPTYRTGWRTWAVVVALSFSVVGATLTNQVNTTIRYQVGTVGGVALASWIANSLFLLTLAFGPVLGNLSDRIGKKWTVLGGCALGIVGTAVSGRASTIGQIIAGQVLTGIADAGCLTAGPSARQ